MNYKFITYPSFDRELKRLAKKYKSLKQDIIDLSKEIEQNPGAGTDLGNNIYKYRLSIASKGKGKRGGGRVITLNVLISEIETEVGFLFIYDKSELTNITDNEIKGIMKKNGIL